MPKFDKQVVYDSIDFGLDRDDPCISGSYITFCREHAWEIGKVTKCWSVTSGAEVLGKIGWFGRWRKYSFFPSPLTVYEEVCLREIAYFCESATKSHKAEKKKAAMV